MGQPLHYRPEIDGLRAVSILLVVAYHAHPWLLPGGFVGVDVFFVISGFLITKILLSENRSGQISIAGFYARRVRRIFPSLLVVLAATYAIGWFILLPDQFEQLGKNIVAGALFTSNLFQMAQAGYFADDAAENPLLHLWSLGVEEQFYIFWPLALVLMIHSCHWRKWTASIALVSFAIGVATVFQHKDWAFYSPITRAWELLIGCALADTRFMRTARNSWFSAVGLALILGSALFLDRSLSFPGAYTILPVAGAALVLISPDSLLNRVALANRQMVWTGLISYPLYLWHWPLLSYLTILRHGIPNFLEIWAAVLISVFLSVLTFRYVERPLRHHASIVPKLAVGLASVASIGIATIMASGFDARFPIEIQRIARVRPQDNAGFQDHCFSETSPAAFNESCIEQGDGPLLMLWGDSTAAALYPGIKLAEAGQHFRLARFSAAGCAPFLVSRNVRCDTFNQLVVEHLKVARPTVLLLHAMWGDYSSLDGLRATIEQLKAIVPRIVILGPVPVWKRSLPHGIVNGYRFSHEIPKRISKGVSGPEADERMNEIASSLGVGYISARRVLCNDDGCLTFAGDTADVITTDNVHLSDAGSRFLIGSVAGLLFDFTSEHSRSEYRQ